MEKIAIIGGGLGGLSAAYALTKEAVSKKYEITVFQMGWRLGGKCATGRGEFGRIEEHGIHAFLGAYYNALCMMTDVYDNWEPDSDYPIAKFEEAFLKENTGLHWERHNGELKRWHKWSPVNQLTLEEIKKTKNLLLLWLGVYAKVLQAQITDDPLSENSEIVPESINYAPFLAGLTSIIEFVTAVEKSDEVLDSSGWENFWASIAVSIEQPIRHSSLNGDNVRRKLLELELFQVILRGVRDDDIVNKGFLVVDSEPFEAWLERHGASINLLQSPIVAYFAKLTFQYPDGDVALKPEMSASSYLQWALRSGTYVEKPLYAFAAGTGETIVTPLYKYLKDRGVKFRFFHELLDIKTNRSGSKVKRLDFQEQAVVKHGKAYDPVIDVKGLSSWPNKPRFAQLVKGNSLNGLDFEKPKAVASGRKKSYKVGLNSEFNQVILAIPPAAIIESAPTLLDRNTHWGNRVKAMPTVATQASQIWLKEPVEDLADMPSHTENNESRKYYYASANFPGEMHGQLDFSKYIQYEDWGENPPRGLLYGCGVMVDPPEIPELSERQSADYRAHETTRIMLTLAGADLLPLSVSQRDETFNPHCLDFNDLYVHPRATQSSSKGQNRLLAQYWRGNVYPSDRYTQAPPATKSMRINPLKPQIENLTGAGDWVDTSLNVGSVECTVMGGLLAAAYINDPDDAKKIIGAWVTQADSLL